MLQTVPENQLSRARPIRAPKTYGWADWLPLLALPPAAMMGASSLPPWGLMWLLAFSIYAGLKWLSWRRRQTASGHMGWRSAAYLLAWPGMDADAFLQSDVRAVKPRLSAWLGAASVTALGVTLFWVGARTLPATQPLLRGWTGMLGLILLLHFGIFRLLALFWQRLGMNAAPIMSAPLSSASLGEFWGRRWNLGFRDLAHQFIFIPAQKKLGTGTASFLVFVASGLIHDLVISLPARGGFGLPTMYFAIQGIGLAVERSRSGKRLGLRQGWHRRLFMAAITAGPAFCLFHRSFVLRVIIPFMEVVHAL
jgi:hypothetical protein